LELVKNTFWPWDKLLDYLTEEEMVRNLERCFPYAAVDFALAKSPFSTLMAGHVKGEFGRMMTKHTTPGFSPPPEATQPSQWNPPAQVPAMNVPSFTPAESRQEVPKPPVIAGTGFAPPGAAHMASGLKPAFGEVLPDKPAFGLGGLSQPARVPLPSDSSLSVRPLAGPQAPSASPSMGGSFSPPAAPAPQLSAPPAPSAPTQAPPAQPVMGSGSGEDRAAVSSRLREMQKAMVPRNG